MEIRERTPSMQETSTVAPLGGDVGDPRTQETSTVDPMGGDARDPRMPTINARNIDGGHVRRLCRRSGSAQHQHKKRRQWAPWEAVMEIQKHPTSTQKTSMGAS
jgi:hypothetical protein